MSESNELVVIEEKSIAIVFQEGGSDPIIAKLQEALDNFVVPDVTTTKGQKEIASFARKFATSKTLLEGHGKALKEQYKVKVDIIDAERKKLKDKCDEFRDAARKPLTDYENAEKKRVADIEERVYTIEDFIAVQLALITTSEEAKDSLSKISAIIVDESFQEFELAATKAKANAVTQIEAKFIVLQNAEKEKAEVERLEKERLEKEKKEREEKIAKEAAKEATRAAEEKAKAESESKDKAAREAVAAAEQATLEAKLATEKAEREKREAADNAEKDKAQAVEDEKKRQAAVAESERLAAEKLAANKAHRGKINRAAKKCFVAEGITEEEAEKIIKLIAKGLIENITINY